MFEKLRDTASFSWILKSKAAPQAGEEIRGVEKIYRPIRTAPPALLVSLCIIVSISITPAVFTSPGDRDDIRAVFAMTFGMMAFFNMILIAISLWSPFFFRGPLDELRIRGRVITVRRRMANRSFWLGDANRLVWGVKDTPVHVYLVSEEVEFMIPLVALWRADSVELFEWLRWGCTVTDEYWPEFCHRIAWPRSGPIDRPLRGCERRRTRRRWDRLMAVAAAATLVAIGSIAFWTGQFGWMAVLCLIPALWMWRFAIPREGKIVVRTPLGPTGYRYSLALAAILALTVISFPFALSGEKNPVTNWIILTAVLFMSALAVAVGIFAEQEKFAKAQTPAWTEQAVSAWNAEAKSGAWALGREARSPTPSARKTGG